MLIQARSVDLVDASSRISTDLERFLAAGGCVDVIDNSNSPLQLNPDMTQYNGRPHSAERSSRGGSTGRALDPAYVTCNDIVTAPGKPGLLRVSKPYFMKRVAQGIYPQPVKAIGVTRLWKRSDIEALAEQMRAGK